MPDVNGRLSKARAEKASKGSAARRMLMTSKRESSEQWRGQHLGCRVKG